MKERYESAPEEDEVAHDVSDLEHDDVGECLSGVLFMRYLRFIIKC